MKRNAALFFLAPLIGFLSYLISRENMDIYSSIITPPFAPEPIVFSIVWTVLYILMGVSSVIIANSKTQYKKSAINIYLLSLIFNFVWSPIFFNRRQFYVSLLVIIILFLLVSTTIRIYKEINRLAAVLQLPYLLWLIAAFYLNIGIILLN